MNETGRQQIKSKKRVADHGEVFTSHREVNAMLDLVKQETERIESRFLEPACGNGNFLEEILRRKLTVVAQRYKNSQVEYEFYAIIAVSSIYGIELLPDNIASCRARLLKVFTDEYKKLYKSIQSDVLSAAEFILNLNIIYGDALTLKNPDNDEPIVFCEWSPIRNGMIKRRDFTMSNLMEPDLKQYNAKISHRDQIPIFSDEGDPAFLPVPVAEYPLIHFLNLGVNDAEELQS